MDLMARAGSFLVAAVLACSLSMAVTVKMDRTEGMTKRGYMPYNTPLLDQPAETLKKEPKYSGTPRYAALEMGNGEDHTITVALDEGDETPKIYIDKNNDEDLTNDGDGAWDSKSDPRPGSTVYNTTMRSVRLDVDYEEDGASTTLPYYINMYRFMGVPDDDRRANLLFYYPGTTLKGTLSDGDKSVLLMLQEPIPDARFDDMLEGGAINKGVAGLMVDYNGDGKIETDARMPEQLGDARVWFATAPFHWNGKSWQIKQISPSGKTLTLETVDTPTEPPAWPELPKVALGDTAPVFTAQTLDGKTLTLSDLRGKVVLLDFWATWCGPCLAELPNVTPTWNKFKNDDFVIVGISFDQKPRTTDEKLKEFTDARDMTWTHIYDGKYWKAEIGVQYDIHSIPAMFLLDRKGVIINKTDTLRGPGALEKAVAAALKSGK